MLSFLVLVSTTGQPLPAAAVGRCTRPPTAQLTFEPVASTTWRADDGHVMVTAWGDRPGGWHVGQHGCTLATSTPWPLHGRFEAPSGAPFELTQRLGDDDAGLLDGLTGTATIVRIRPDGTGLIGAPTTGGGAIHVAEGDGVLAIADRAAVAGAAAGGATRRADLPGLLRGTVLGEQSPITGVERLRPGGHVLLRGRLGAKRVDAATPWAEPTDASTAELAAAAADDVARLLELAASVEGDRVVELGEEPGSLVVAAALAATGTASRFTLRPRDGRSAQAGVVRLARALDAAVDRGDLHPAGGEALDARVRAAVGRVAGAAAVTTGRAGPLSGIRRAGAVLVCAAPGGPLAPDAGAPGDHLLTSEARETRRAADEEWLAGRGRVATTPAGSSVLAELDRRWPLRQRATADLLDGARLLDPLAVPSVAALAVHAAERGERAVDALVAALHPPLLDHTGPSDDVDAAVAGRRWPELAPVLEAHVLGHARERLAAVLDLDEVAAVVRSHRAPDADTIAVLEGALTLAVWSAATDLHRPSPGTVPSRPRTEVPHQVPTLVTGVTSAGLLELTGVAVPLDDVDTDAMLGTRVDREARDLVLRVLLAVDAAPGHLPADLDERLSGPATAHLADPARALLARRGGTLADARLALTLPFWRSHVGSPRVVLVAERPPDLAGRSPSALPTVDLLGWWVDAMTCAASARADVRIVDPNDLLDQPEAEAVSWEGLADDDAEVLDLLRVVRTVDSLVREVELDAARPLLRTIRLARAEDRGGEPARLRSAPAAAPLRVVDELWERAVEADRRLAAQHATADELQQRLTTLESELAEVRARRGLKAAWQVLRGTA